ncbi:hypothetical protein Kpol_479p23 [Vanderwaltozyma polyspora DSM 70294]|uniref:COX assembly mitochondrial protein n=1 Tax=Vanderwaltozyma polyspora (strain ATCC 22028 / DSM 70294 / BCRC 21397 / CBS 2163 / NBRC 10782 / NRRL Y-8283 / UCD 57-17) TaxID=436907 RepID=A7TQD6_VANPO|nr:uncharacterized protein Kpol_479p23 [Vanderwaltozyma polyspora DSM 70294]EDO15535.1 hypothetical protein Kpol_479p23 [Vanderwaltozyma polyspora DSM 70294]
MHPQLEAQRFYSCAEFIDALERCHEKEFYKRMFGVCNNEKEALTKCLKETKRTLTIKSIEESKAKRKVIEDKWKKSKEEEFGEDAILKKIMERHNISMADIDKD